MHSACTVTIYLLVIFILAFGSGQNLSLLNVKLIYYISAIAFFLSAVVYVSNVEIRRKLWFLNAYVVMLSISFIYSILFSNSERLFSDIPSLLIPCWLPIFILALSPRKSFERFSITIETLVFVLLVFNIFSYALLNNGLDIYSWSYMQLISAEVVDYPQYFYINSFIFYLYLFWASNFGSGLFKALKQLILLVMSVISGQRGLPLVMLLLILIYRLFRRKYAQLIFGVIVFGIIIMAYVELNSLYLDRSISDSDLIRYETFNEVVESISLSSIFFGHGLGVGIEIRPVHFENFWLEIFHKQGIWGIIAQFLLLTPLFQYLRLSQYVRNPQLCAWSMALIGMLILSLSNPYYGNYYGYVFYLVFTSAYLCTAHGNINRSSII